MTEELLIPKVVIYLPERSFKVQGTFNKILQPSNSMSRFPKQLFQAFDTSLGLLHLRSYPSLLPR